MKRKSWELKLIFLVLVAVFAIFLAVPAIRLLLKSFLGEDGLTGAYYLDVFSGKGFTTALGNSFVGRFLRPGLVPMGAVSFGGLGFRIIRFLFRLPLWRDVLLFRRGSAFLDAVVGFRRLDQFPHFLNLIFRQVLFPAVLFTYL